MSAWLSYLVPAVVTFTAIVNVFAAWSLRRTRKRMEAERAASEDGR